MNKRDALRMKPGDYILYGSHANMQYCIRADGFHWGRVCHVTPKGGIKIDALMPNGVTLKGHTEWVPYHHVFKHERAADHRTRYAFSGPASGTIRT
jgi:hypothetical protein